MEKQPKTTPAKGAVLSQKIAQCLEPVHSAVFKMLDVASIGIVAFNEISHLVYINQRVETLLDCKAQDVLGYPITRLFQDQRLIDWIHGRAIETTEPYVWIDRSLIVTRNSVNGSRMLQGGMLLIQKMSSVDPSEERISRLRSEMSSLLENIYDGIILADDETILNVNPSFGRITGVAPSSLKGLKISELDTKKHICLAAVQEVIRLTRYHKRTLTIQRRLTSGNEIFITGNPVFDRHNQMTRVVLTIRDITDLRNIEEQIKKVSVLCEENNHRIAETPLVMKEIVAESPLMRRLLDLLVRVARVDSTILLHGESGVGKDVFARLIYRLSERRQKPFISVNCGAIPETLLESEFFGYERGAFTNALPNGKAGLFEQANGGILFLDEVGELPFNLQVKLLKVIQDRRCRRLSGTKSLDLNLRIIAASNQDLTRMVDDGLFRADLYYRLYVVPIEIPPLRERREDILPLALIFLRQFNKKYEAARTLGHELSFRLETYSWPGNVRELQNVIERMVVTANADVLAPHHLPPSIYKQVDENPPCRGIPKTLNLKIARESLERELITKAITQTGNFRKAAKLLGVDHSTVVRKAQRYRLNTDALGGSGPTGNTP